MEGDDFYIGSARGAIANGPAVRRRRIECAKSAVSTSINCPHDGGEAGARAASPQAFAKFLVGCGGHLHGLVEAAAVDVRNFGSHRPQIRTELSAVMDRMIGDKREVGSGRQFEHPECRDDLGKFVR